jgi:hypothetical protein
VGWLPQRKRFRAKNKSGNPSRRLNLASIWLTIRALPLGPTGCPTALREPHTGSGMPQDGPALVAWQTQAMPRRIVIDENLLRAGTATAIAKRLGISVDTVLSRQRDAGIPIRPQGHRDRYREMLADMPDWMLEDSPVPTRSTWA